MPDLPDAAVAVIAEALHRQQCHSALCTTGPSKQDIAKARTALAKVAPAIAAAEREACARLAEQESDYCGVPIADLILASLETP